MHREDGFTLVEMLAAMALSAILLTLGASALRTYWHNRSLHGAQEQAVTQLRQLQTRVMSESHPLVYGARFTPGTSSWSTVEYQPAAGGDPERCTQTPRTFESNVRVASASFSNATGVTSFCAAELGVPASQLVFFFARGTATEGSVALENASLPGRSLGFTVKPMTGRVQVMDS